MVVGMKNSPSVGGAARNVSPLITRNAPPALQSPFSSNGDSPQRCGRCRSSPSSTDDSDVCATPGVSDCHGVLMLGVQVRHASDDFRVDSLAITMTSKSVF